MEILIVLATVVVIYFIFTFNSLVAIKNNVSKAWANIDVLLKQRHDELPKLIDTCKQYMQHEQQTLENVIKARSGVDKARQLQDVAGLAVAESALQGSLGGLFALAENYPDLKADQSFNALQSRITGLENAIADRREFYNDSVNVNNVRVAQFPDLIVANLLGFKTLNLLKFASAELKDVDVNKRFNS
ncbi:MAG: LemA family protein [Methylophilaceae bacterium]